MTERIGSRMTQVDFAARIWRELATFRVPRGYVTPDCAKRQIQRRKKFPLKYLS